MDLNTRSSEHSETACRLLFLLEWRLEAVACFQRFHNFEKRRKNIRIFSVIKRANVCFLLYRIVNYSLKSNLNPNLDLNKLFFWGPGSASELSEATTLKWTSFLLLASGGRLSLCSEISRYTVHCDPFILFFKSSWCNSSYSSNRPRNWKKKNSSKQQRRPLPFLLYLSFLCGLCPLSFSSMGDDGFEPGTTWSGATYTWYDANAGGL